MKTHFRSEGMQSGIGGVRGEEREEDAAHKPHDDRRAGKQKRQKKIFDKNEGEYVDFEEIK